MRYSTTSAMVLGALIGEVVAGPTHAHMHRHAHEKKDVDWSALDWNNMGIDWTSAWKAGQQSTAAPVPAATATGAAPVAAQPTPAASKPAASSQPAAPSSSESIGSEITQLWNDLVGAANHITAFGQKTPTSGSEVGYIGNVGYPVEGSNMMMVSSVAGYQFTNEFINTSGQTMTVVVWNKAASQGMKEPLKAVANLGSCIAPTTPALTFALAPGASQIVAFDEESVIGWAEATSAVAESGQFATTWGEVQFQVAGSGYDVSAIMNAKGNSYKMTITSVEAPACTSSESENMWLTPTDPVGTSDGSCYIAQSTAHLTTKMGGEM